MMGLNRIDKQDENVENQAMHSPLIRGNSKFKWTTKTITIAHLMADGKTNQQICDEVKVSQSSIIKYKKHPEFQKAVRAIVAETEKRILNSGIATRANRVRLLSDLVDGMLSIRDQRASEFKNVPGGNTGLLTVTRRKIGEQIVDETGVFDSRFVQELRNTVAAIQDEVGDNIDRHEVSGPDGKPINLSVNLLDDITYRALQYSNKAGRIEDDDVIDVDAILNSGPQFTAPNLIQDTADDD
jgi:hypothetical protein